MFQLFLSMDLVNSVKKKTHWTPLTFIVWTTNTQIFFKMSLSNILSNNCSFPRQQWLHARTSQCTNITHVSIIFSKEHFCFLGMRCLFPLFQTQFHLLKPKLVYILRGSVNLFLIAPKGDLSQTVLSHDPGRPSFHSDS